MHGSTRHHVTLYLLTGRLFSSRRMCPGRQLSAWPPACGPDDTSSTAVDSRSTVQYAVAALGSSPYFMESNGFRMLMASFVIRPDTVLRFPPKKLRRSPNLFSFPGHCIRKSAQRLMKRQLLVDSREKRGVAFMADPPPQVKTPSPAHAAER